MAKTCKKCGKVLKSHGKGTRVCRECFSVDAIFCQTCGTELPKYNRKTKQCRKCWRDRGRQVWRYCQRCKNSLSPKAAVETKVCRACRSHPRPQCLDCGKRLEKSSRDTRRCWPCHLANKRTQASQKTCSIEGCTQAHQAKGFCMKHYTIEHHRRQFLGRGWPGNFKVQRRDIALAPCRICGYNRLPSHLHRIIPGSQGGRYVAGNVVPLCARCHEEVTRGLTPSPVTGDMPPS